jgi:alpha-N-acetylglucosamine transferase
MKICIAAVLKSGKITDVNVLKKHLQDHEIDVIDVSGGIKIGKYDIIFIIEHITPPILKINASYKVWIPNVEMLTGWDMELIKGVDLIMCKTKVSYEYFKNKHNSVYTSFTSICNKKELANDKKLWIHLGGTSYMKGTVYLLKYWINNFTHLDIKLLVTFKRSKEYPDFDDVMTMWRGLKKDKLKSFMGKSMNVERYKNIYRVERMTKEQYSYFTNKASVFIQPSVNEGFGHVINEKRCLNTLMITTNAPPMNTFSDLTIDYRKTLPMHKVNKYAYAYRSGIKGYIIDETSFVDTINKVLKMDDAKKSIITDKMNDDYEKNDKYFSESFTKVVNNVHGGGDIITSKYAYVMLMFGGDKYLPGVLTMAYSIRLHNKNDVVCMVTPDVSQSAIHQMQILGIIVYKVNYLKYKTKKMKSKRQQQLYSTWQDKAFTKWHCLTLTQYDKVLFLDADMLVVDKSDDIFLINTPAGIFKNPWLSSDIYDNHSIIPQDAIKYALNNNGFVPSATCILLEPKMAHFKKYKNMVRSMQPFGLKSVSMFDEQSIAYFYSVYAKGPRVKWYKLGIEYAYMWKYKNTKPVIVDFFGDTKPWDLDENAYPDIKPWHDTWKIVKRVLEENMTGGFN